MAEISSEAELRALLGEPVARAVTKERQALHDFDKQWLAASPLCLIATAAADGTCDVSPKGDPPGFTRVLDDTTIAIPERPGNRRADGFRNILANPHIGLIYLVPGRGDTLRINGRARLISDAPYFDDMTVKGHRPVLATVVTIEQVFYHCAKSFLRAEVWNASSWRPAGVPPRSEIAQRLERPDADARELERYYGPDYAKGLYRTS